MNPDPRLTEATTDLSPSTSSAAASPSCRRYDCWTSAFAEARQDLRVVHEEPQARAGNVALTNAPPAGEESGPDMSGIRKDAMNQTSHRSRLAAEPLSPQAHPSNGRRASNIKEEATGSDPSAPSSNGMSLIIAAAFESPSNSNSTESTGTLRGSAIQTPAPASASLRTPSYPFPYVPSTPRDGHRPFTTLSPTVSRETEDAPLSQRLRGVTSTGSPPADAFLPPAGSNPGTDLQPTEEPPNLYDVVLMLNLDPGLSDWWLAVCNIFQKCYGAARLSLSLPADAGDMENVPWGQKATFNASGPSESKKRHRPRESGSPNTRRHHAAQPPHHLDSMSPERRPSLSRPHLVSRHSHAGFEREPKFTINAHHPASRLRPAGPLRVSTYSGQYPALESEIESEAPPQFRQASHSGTEFSTQSDERVEPFSQVLPVLRALNFESQALLEAPSVNKVLEKGSLVTLTRVFSTRSKATNEAKKPALEGDSFGPTLHPGQGQSDTTSEGRDPSHHGGGATSTSFEDYEQAHTPPWSQSPAPSPAEQNDPLANPFFAQPDVNEDTFRPPDVAIDYADLGRVQAIGVDKASTVMHIPLIHPRFSHSQHFRRIKPPSPRPLGDDVQALEGPQDSGTSHLRNAPLAVLSFCAPAVPYPHHLIQSIQLLSPHLATTFDLAQQYSNIRTQNDSMRRRGGRGHSGSDGKAMDGDDTEIEATPNDSTSLTSPSEYSGRSRQSPAGSAGTPGGEFGFNAQHASTGSPSQNHAAEMVESYFDAKKRMSGSGLNSRSLSHARSIDMSKDVPSRDKDILPGRSMTQNSGSDGQPRKSHTLLHSYGADLPSTFQGLPSSAFPSFPSPRFPAARSLLETADALEMSSPSEKLLRIVMDALPCQIFISSPGTGILTWANSKFIIYRGKEISEVLKDPWRAIHPEDKPGYMEEWHRSLMTEQQFSRQVRLRRFDREYRWFYVRATPLKNKRQRTVHWTGTCMDIHEQHVAEVNSARQQETAASEAKYRALANSSPQIVFAVVRSRGVTFCNTQWLGYSGQTEEEACGWGFTSHVHPADLEKCRIPMFANEEPPRKDSISRVPHDSTGSSSRNGSAESLGSRTTIGATKVPVARKPHELPTGEILKLSYDQSGRPFYSTEVRLQSKDGQYRWHLVRVLLAEPAPGDESDETWYGTCTDINDHKLLEQALKETMDAKSQFLSNMSHEIRTPLNGIMGMVNFLMDSSLTSEQMEHVDILRNSTEGLQDLINDILDLSKVEAGMIVLDPEWLHLRSLIEEVDDMMFALALDKKLELNYIMEPDVPVMLKGDRFRIRQILLNVLGNAIKFTETGEVVVWCGIRKSQEDVISQDGLKPEEPLGENEIYVSFQVIDTGRGFDEEQSKALFKRFSQVHDANKQLPGTGLGLAISMQLVKLHGGDMTAASMPGEGSTFTLCIKCAIPSDGDRPPMSAATSAGSIPMADAPTPDVPELTRAGRTAFAPTVSSAPSPEITQSPLGSSGSSDPSIRTNESGKSHESSISSVTSEPSKRPAIPIALPPHIRDDDAAPTVSSKASNESFATDASSGSLGQPILRAIPQPPIFSILVVCPLAHARAAIVSHIELTLPKQSAHHLTVRDSIRDCAPLLWGASPVIFSHIFVDVRSVPEISALLRRLLRSGPHAATCVAIATDPRHRRDIQAGPWPGPGPEPGTTAALEAGYTALEKVRRVLFVFKPLKASKVATVFDPRGVGELAADRRSDGARALVTGQRKIFSELKLRLGDRGLQVLLVEDNVTSQKVGVWSSGLRR
jgi:signal transduction histidine kinase